MNVVASRAFRVIPEILLAYQYGSSVKHPDRNPRDIDIAVLLKPGSSPERRFEIQTEVGDRLRRKFGKEVDVKILNETSPSFAHQVLKEGRLIFGHRAVARKFVVETLTRWFNYLPIHQFFLERLEKRLNKVSHG